MSFIILSIFFLLHQYHLSTELEQTYLVKEQQHQIECLYSKIKTLYQDIFELEELCEDLILELQDKQLEHAALAHKNRIMHAHQNF
jgi:hypothetical protein